MLNEYTLQAVNSAKIAAELFWAQDITRSLSLSSKNLWIITKRIGESAAGLAVLASFYDERSRESILLADHVRKVTVQTANYAVNEWRHSLFEDKLEQACNKMEAVSIPPLVSAVLNAKHERVLKRKEQMALLDRKLFDLLTSMQNNIRSIAVIAVNSKIEAPRTGAHSAVLIDIAQKVEDMTSQILNHINIALKLLTINNQSF